MFVFLLFFVLSKTPAESSAQSVHDGAPSTNLFPFQSINHGFRTGHFKIKPSISLHLLFLDGGNLCIGCIPLIPNHMSPRDLPARRAIGPSRNCSEGSFGVCHSWCYIAENVISLVLIISNFRLQNGFSGSGKFQRKWVNNKLKRSNDAVCCLWPDGSPDGNTTRSSFPVKHARFVRLWYFALCLVILFLLPSGSVVADCAIEYTAAGKISYFFSLYLQLELQAFHHIIRLWRVWDSFEGLWQASFF